MSQLVLADYMSAMQSSLGGGGVGGGGKLRVLNIRVQKDHKPPWGGYVI